MPGSECPSEDELSAFVLGTLPEVALEALARHLETCPACEARAQRLDERSDPLVEGLRRCAAPGRSTLGRRPSPERIGDYRLQREIGRGGMGIVYEAEQVSLGRRVALKVLPRHALLDASAIERFRREARAAGRLHHTNIVPVYGTGEEDGLHYFAMQYIPGAGLDAVIREMKRPRTDGPQNSDEPPADLLNVSVQLCVGGESITQKAPPPTPPSDPATNPDSAKPDSALTLRGCESSSARNRTYWASVARVGVQVADALEYAHSQGVIHRDIKPSNLILDRDGIVWVTDFGLAKSGPDGGDLTNTGDLIGTLRYTPPERFEGAGDARGDVYSLGLTLYELLTLRPAFSGSDRNKLLHAVMHTEPIRPRALVPALPRDLETIVLKAIARDPGARYRRAGDLADDLRRFMDGQPIRARPTPAWELVWKAARRHPGVAALALALVLVAVTGFALVAWQWQRAALKAHEEEQTRRRAERQSAVVSLTQGSALCEAGAVDRGLLWFAHALALAEHTGAPDLARVARYNLAAWRPLLVTAGPNLHHAGWTWAAAWSPDGTRVATGGSDGLARIWDAATGRLMCQMRQPYAVWAVAWHRDGTRVLVGSGPIKDPIGSARLWNVSTGQPLGPALPHPDKVTAVAFNPDGDTFVTVTEVRAELWHTADSRSVAGPLWHPLPPQNPRVMPALCAAYSPDGNRLVTAGEDGTARVWDARTGRGAGVRPMTADGPIQAVTFSPDGKRILTGDFMGKAQLWDAESGAPAGPPMVHRGPVRAVAFGPDGRIVATGSMLVEREPGAEVARVKMGEARLWLADTGWHLGPPLAHPQPVWSVALSPDGRLLMTGCEDGAARLFLTATGAPVGRPIPGSGTVTAVGFNRAGTAAVMTGAGGHNSSEARVSRVHVGTGAGRLFAQRGNAGVLAFDPEERVLAVGASDRTARLWDLGSGRLAVPALVHPDSVAALAFTPDGSALLTGTAELMHSRGVLRLWDRSTGALRNEFTLKSSVTGVGFVSGGRRALVTTQHGQLFAWDLAGAPVAEPVPEPGQVLALGIRDDGQTLVLATSGSPGIWDRGAGRWRFRKPELRGWTSDAAFFPDGERVLFVTDGYGLVVDAKSGTSLGPTVFHADGGIWRLALSPDGATVLVASRDGSARLWDVATGRQLGPPLGRDGMTAVAISASGRHLAAGGSDGRIAVWEPVVPATGSPEQLREEIERLTGLTLDAEGVIRSTAPAGP
jgi:WD40 repeat protein/serine/threonine protein kinase